MTVLDSIIAIINRTIGDDNNLPNCYGTFVDVWNKVNIKEGKNFLLLTVKEKFRLIKENPLYLYWIPDVSENCPIKLQILAVRESKYNEWIICRCDMGKFPEKVLQEILDNLIIKDIIE